MNFYAIGYPLVNASWYYTSMEKHRVYKVSFASIYPLYVTKAERKGQSKADVDKIINWLTGYDEKEFTSTQADLENFFTNAPKLNPLRRHITGMICGVRVEEIKEPIMREIRYLDKLIDELARGKSMDKILRS